MGSQHRRVVLGYEMKIIFFQSVLGNIRLDESQTEACKTTLSLQ